VGMGSKMPEPVEPTAGHTFEDGSDATVTVLPLTVAPFQVPQIFVGGIGVGATAPHCQSPAVDVGLSVMSVTKSDGLSGRPDGSVAARQPISNVPTLQPGAAGVGSSVHPVPLRLLAPKRIACSSL